MTTLRALAKIEGHLERIRSAGVRMNQLIDDLLALARVTKGEMRREPVDLSALAGVVADSLEKFFPDRDLEFVIAPALRVTGDSRLLRIVLENLMRNAVKFTAARRKARVEFGVQKQAGVPVYFVRDNGAGFNMAHAGKHFVPFQRRHEPASASPQYAASFTSTGAASGPRGWWTRGPSSSLHCSVVSRHSTSTVPTVRCRCRQERQLRCF